MIGKKTGNDGFVFRGILKIERVWLTRVNDRCALDKVLNRGLCFAKFTPKPVSKILYTGEEIKIAS